MRVILLQDVRGVGRRHEVKEVNSGYARNFLIAKKFATPATPETLAKKTAADSHEEALVKKIRAASARLRHEPLEFRVRADERGTLFGGIGREEVLTALRKKGYDVAAIELPHPIKTVGEHRITARFPRGITGEAKVIVRPELKPSR